MEVNKIGKRLKGIYLVPDPLMMKPHFGPSEHIKVGLQELGKYFDMELVVLGQNDPGSLSGSAQGKSFKTKGIGVNNGFLGLLRDLKLLFISNKTSADLLIRLRNSNVDFIYERGQYLDFRGLRAARKFGIHHFYEVNWLNFLGIRQFYKSWFNPTARKLEEWAYRKSTLNFFVGTQHLLINIPSEKVYTIQNGIHAELLTEFDGHRNTVSDKLKICYVANLMPHHRFDIFAEALQRSGVGSKIELHLVGYNFEKFQSQLMGISSVYHGPTSKDKLPEIMKSCNIGLISGGPSYSSFMKLFEYAAFKLCVICPDLENIKWMFEDHEILYFKTDSVQSLSEALSHICSHQDKIGQFGENIHKKVSAKYTWEKIYEGIAVKIREACND